MTDDDWTKETEKVARELASMAAPTAKPIVATRHCRHYSWDREAAEPRCAWGVDLVTEPKASNVCQPPGLQDLRKCDYREEYTDAERVAWEEWRGKSHLRAAAIMALIPGTSRKRDIHWGTNGRFQCPACLSGMVSWVRTKVNGHVHAKCSTRGCFEVMQ